MEILGFLFGLICLVVVAWAIALLGGLVFGRKRRQRRRTSVRWSQSEPPQASPNPTEQKRSRVTPAPSLPVPQVSPRQTVLAQQPLVSSRGRLVVDISNTFALPPLQ